MATVATAAIMVTDRLTVVLFTLAAFLAVLALLAHQLPAAGYARPTPPVHLLRRIYRTTVVETIVGGAGAGRTSVSQSVSSSGAGAVASVPVTRTS